MALLSTKENETILQALLQCGQQARQAASQPFEVFEKGHEDYVTTVDRSLDQYLSKVFTAQFPQDGIVTEENQASAAEFLAAHQRLWLIDPIDGTEDFIQRRPHYSIMIGLLADNRPQAGWVYAPALGQLYWGGPGWGLFQYNDTGESMPLHPCAPASGNTQIMLLGDRDQRRFGSAITQLLPDIVFNSIGSFGLKVLEVIKGQAGLYVYLNGRVKLWDTTGPLALAQAGGLVCCDLDGQPLQFNANSIYPYTLTHRQPIVIGWPTYVEALRPTVRQAVMTIRSQELALGRGIV